MPDGSLQEMNPARGGSLSAARASGAVAAAGAAARDGLHAHGPFALVDARHRAAALGTDRLVALGYGGEQFKAMAAGYAFEVIARHVSRLRKGQKGPRISGQFIIYHSSPRRASHFTGLLP